MLRRRYLWLVLTLLCVLTAAPVAWGQLEGVPRDHWAYDAVRSLADRGLVTGYPDGQFLGDRQLTRYEMATIILRVLQRVEDASQGSSPAAPTMAPTSTETSADDLNTVTRLVEGFKVELTVIGADLKAVKEQVAALSSEVEAVQDDVAALEADVTAQKEGLEEVANDVSRMKRLKFSGYVQARYVDAQGSDSQFTVRRARLKTEGMLGSRTGVEIQLDAAGSSGDESVTLKDALVSYFLTGDPDSGPAVTLGQFKWPFGYELVQSSGNRETPERAHVLRTLFPGERDRGFMITGPAEDRFYWALGLFNGVGIDERGSNTNPWYSTNLNDNNSHKDVVGQVRYHLSRNLAIGASGYWGKAGGATMTSTAASNPQFLVPLTEKNRYGIDVQWSGESLPLSLRAEYIWAREPRIPASATSAAAVMVDGPSGYYAQAAYTFGPKWLGVYKYDTYDDDNPTSATGELKNHNLGLIYWLDNASRLKLFYEWRQEERNPRDNDGLTVEWITKF